MNEMTTAARWPRLATWGAAAWSLGYGALGLFWAYGGAGFPFGEGDIPDARAESFLGTATAAGTGPVIASLGAAGALVAVAMTRRWPHRTPQNPGTRPGAQPEAPRSWAAQGTAVAGTAAHGTTRRGATEQATGPGTAAKGAAARLGMEYSLAAVEDAPTSGGAAETRATYNRAASSRVAADTEKHDRAAPDTAAPDGAKHDGTAPNTAAPDGAKHDRAAPNTAAPHEGKYDGAAPDTAKQDGAASDGARKVGAGHNGLARVVRGVVVAFAWVAAFVLVALIPDARIMTAVGYAPIFLVGLPFGWPDANYFELAFPWPVVNMLLCAGGGVLWAGAALAFQRRTAGACESCGRTHGRSGVWVGRAARWGTWAAYVGFVVPLFYSVVRWAWALGVPLLFSEEGVKWLHETGMAWAGAGLATFGALGGVLTLGLARPWGRIWPRWVPVLAGRAVNPRLPVTLGALVTGVLASAGMVAIRITDWTDPQAWLTSPMAYWPLWAAALGMATLGYYFRTRPGCRRCENERQAVPAR